MFFGGDGRAISNAPRQLSDERIAEAHRRKSELLANFEIALDD
jgi:hypothetical protein